MAWSKTCRLSLLGRLAERSSVFSVMITMVMLLTSKSEQEQSQQSERAVSLRFQHVTHEAELFASLRNRKTKEPQEQRNQDSVEK